METEDQKVFGSNVWVYCAQHLRPHLTGWCTVPVTDKISLGLQNEPGNEVKARLKCQQFNLKVV